MILATNFQAVILPAATPQDSIRIIHGALIVSATVYSATIQLHANYAKINII